MRYARFAPLVVLVPTVALAAPRTFGELANLLVLILNNATTVLIVLGIVLYFFGISTNILKFSEEGGEKLKQFFFWGIIVIFVMVSIWGILRLLQNTLFGANPYSGGGGAVPVQQAPFLPPQFNP
jgi:hypothetical protein